MKQTNLGFIKPPETNIKTDNYILVPISGGKDSTASLLIALENNPKDKIVPVFNDTGWEHPLTYDYINYLQDKLGIKINKTHGGERGETLVDVIRNMKKFPFGRGRFCTMYMKQYSLRDWYKNNLYDPDKVYEMWFGMRTQESGQRARKYAGISPKELFDMEDIFPSRYNKKLKATLKVRLPVVDWTTTEVFDYLEKKGVDKNPLYNEGTNDRVGCYPCMLAGKKVQEKMFATEVGQERLKIIRQLEKEIGQKYEMFDTDQGSCEVCNI